MIIIPEIERVVILTPRTSSGTVRRLIAQTYPQSIALYRHMEADGVPDGYENWPRMGVVREPRERMWSMYKFLRHNIGGASRKDALANGDLWLHEQVQSAQVSFRRWLLHRQVNFSTPHRPSADRSFAPFYTVKHSLPEQRKSQFITLRPDLGTLYYYFEHLPVFYKDLGLAVPAHATNKTPATQRPKFDEEMMHHMLTYHQWECELYGVSKNDQ